MQSCCYCWILGWKNRAVYYQRPSALTTPAWYETLWSICSLVFSQCLVFTQKMLMTVSLVETFPAAPVARTAGKNAWRMQLWCWVCAYTPFVCRFQLLGLVAPLHHLCTTQRYPSIRMKLLTSYPLQIGSATLSAAVSNVKRMRVTAQHKWLAACEVHRPTGGGRG